MDVNTPRKKCVRCVEFYSKEGQKKDRNGTIIGFPLITIIPISAAAVVTYLFVDPCCLDPIFQENIDRMRTDSKGRTPWSGVRYTRKKLPLALHKGGVERDPWDMSSSKTPSLDRHFLRSIRSTSFRPK